MFPELPRRDSTVLIGQDSPVPLANWVICSGSTGPTESAEGSVQCLGWLRPDAACSKVEVRAWPSVAEATNRTAGVGLPPNDESPAMPRILESKHPPDPLPEGLRETDLELSALNGRSPRVAATKRKCLPEGGPFLSKSYFEHANRPSEACQTDLCPRPDSLKNYVLDHALARCAVSQGRGLMSGAAGFEARIWPAKLPSHPIPFKVVVVRLKSPFPKS